MSSEDPQEEMQIAHLLNDILKCAEDNSLSSYVVMQTGCRLMLIAASVSGLTEGDLRGRFEALDIKEALARLWLANAEPAGTA